MVDAGSRDFKRKRHGHYSDQAFGVAPELLDQHLFESGLDLIGRDRLAVDFADRRIGTLGTTDGHRVALSHHAFTVFGLGAGEADGTQV